VLAMSQPSVAHKPVTLINKIPDKLPLVYADENRLQQILYNLVGNACKFTHEGEITLSAQQKDRNLLISVSDTGIGIPEDQQKSIFQSFQQGDGSTAREYGGTGLGLSVSKQLVEAHQGSLEVVSAPGKGSTFTFSLPIADIQTVKEESSVHDDSYRHLLEPAETRLSFHQATETITAQKSESVPETPDPDGRPPRTVLVVDDEVINIQTVKNLLELNNYRVLAAQDGFQALTIIEEGVPDLVLLDLMMPRMSGYEVCQKLRATYSSTSLPIVMLTAKNQMEDIVQGFQIGANDYVTKPFKKEELLARMNTLVQLKEAMESLKTTERLKMELETARTVQEFLIPQEDPQLEEIEISSYYQSASETGGDWYDYRYAPDLQTLEVVVGDVTGHGVPAALVTAMVDSFYESVYEQYRHAQLFKQQEHHLLHPNYFMNLVNKVLYKTVGGRYHMTLFHSVIDLKQKRMIYSSASHNPCYIWRPSKFSVERNGKIKQRDILQLHLPGVALGHAQNSEYRIDFVELQKDDVILWYTDGLIENFNEKGEEYGSRRLQRLLKDSKDLSAEQIKDRIIRTTTEFCGNTPAEDDVTLIVGKVK